MQQNTHADMRHKAQHRDCPIGPQSMHSVNLPIKNMHYFTLDNTHSS